MAGQVAMLICNFHRRSLYFESVTFTVQACDRWYNSCSIQKELMDAGCLEKVKLIDVLSERLHKDKAASDGYIFRSLLEHVEEVRSLKAAGNEHWKAEAMDIIIHNLVLLSRYGVDDKVMLELLARRLGCFEEKISQNLRDKK